jgi:glucokinase-like ROK family protein
MENKEIKTGDSYFVPAKDEKIDFEGDMTLVISSVRRYAVGIDLGGTFIKGGICDDAGNIIVSDKTETCADGGAEVVAGRIAALCKSLLEKAGLTANDVCGIGMGVPGMIDSEKGEVVYANNLGWEHFAICSSVKEKTGLDVKIANDANVAALGEAVFGAGKGCKNVVMLTLGTGVGGGLILDGKLYEGNGSAGAELGHFVMIKDGEQCTCGRRGCYEAYASATALIRDTKRAIKNHPESLMSEAEQVDGRTAFIYRYKDKYAAKVVDDYIGYLATGITNIANVFRPEKVIIGGGISGEGEKLMAEIQQRVDAEIYAGTMGPAVKIETAALGNRAGTLGAAALVFGDVK